MGSWLQQALKQQRQSVDNIIIRFPQYGYLQQTGGIPKIWSEEKADISIGPHGRVAEIAEKLSKAEPQSEPQSEPPSEPQPQPRSQPRQQSEDQDMTDDLQSVALTETTIAPNPVHLPFRRTSLGQRGQCGANIHSSNVGQREEMSQYDNDNYNDNDNDNDNYNDTMTID